MTAGRSSQFRNFGGIIQTNRSTPANPKNPKKRSRTQRTWIYRAAVGGLVLLCLLQLILIITLRSASSTRPTNTLSNLEQVLEHGWSYFNYSLYQLSNKTLPWSEAREQCRSKRAELVIINTKEEQDFIQSITRNQYIWVGLTSDWKWVDGTPETGTIWDGRSLKSECVLFGKSLYNTLCSDKRSWICEKLVYRR
ncbi:hepatic lectin-like [Astyanax mexicanus]|uniref:hepatic lectin-like n=1 Tax=Astyanax mexicanus TaxID=7994 RepID=UPI0020CB2B09|nr:hepatic lectin-like [Astyanax mexicanus]